MRKRTKAPEIHETEEVSATGVEGFFEKIVTPFGNGAKIDCPRQYLGRPVYVIIRRPDAAVGETTSRRRTRAEE